MGKFRAPGPCTFIKKLSYFANLVPIKLDSVSWSMRCFTYWLILLECHVGKEAVFLLFLFLRWCAPSSLFPSFPADRQSPPNPHCHRMPKRIFQVRHFSSFAKRKQTQRNPLPPVKFLIAKNSLHSLLSLTQRFNNKEKLPTIQHWCLNFMEI